VSVVIIKRSIEFTAYFISNLLSVKMEPMSIEDLKAVAKRIEKVKVGRPKGKD
jgi:hypothetical protein